MDNTHLEVDEWKQSTTGYKLCRQELCSTFKFLK